MLGEEAAGQVDVFGRHAHPLAAPGAIMPRRRPRDRPSCARRSRLAARRPRHWRAPKPSGVSSCEPRVGVRHLLAHQILAGDAEMRRAGGELADDLGRRQKGDLDVRQTGDGAAIVARAAPLDEARGPRGRKTPPCSPAGAPWRARRGRAALSVIAGIGAHQRSPPFASRSSQIAAPTAGMSASGAEASRETVVAAAAERGLARRRAASMASNTKPV